MYHLPMVHKDSIHPPGRPIVSGIDSVTARIVDFYLQLLVRKAPSYLKGTKETIKLLELVDFCGILLLITADVAALNT